MKTPLIYGLYLALAGLLVNLGLYFAGFHSDVDKMKSVQWPSLAVFIVLAVLFIVLGIKARRAEIPVTEDFGYGRAFGTGVLVGAFSCVFGIVTNLIYTHVINRGFNELMLQMQMARMEASGASSDRIEKAEAMMRSPVMAVINGAVILIVFMIILTIIAAIAAAFLKRPAQQDLTPPPVVA